MASLGLSVDEARELLYFIRMDYRVPDTAEGKVADALDTFARALDDFAILGGKAN